MVFPFCICLVRFFSFMFWQCNLNKRNGSKFKNAQKFVAHTVHLCFLYCKFFYLNIRRFITPNLLVKYLTNASKVSGFQPASMGHFLPYSERKNFCWISFDVLLKTELDPVSQILTNILELGVSFHVN